MLSVLRGVNTCLKRDWHRWLNGAMIELELWRWLVGPWREGGMDGWMDG